MSKDKISDDKKALRVVIRYRIGTRVQKEVAKKGGLDPTTMSQYASGGRYPRGANMAKLASALDCSVSMLKEGIAKVLSVADSGGDEKAMYRALDRHFLGSDAGEVESKFNSHPDPTLRRLIKHCMKANNELFNYLITTAAKGTSESS